jgi:L-ribulose-5-phosphate 4-epimerase
MKENSLYDTEGVIKYSLDHQHGPLPASIDIRAINAWRNLLFRLGLVGQDPARYHGLGYGNVSERLTANAHGFLITGTQTGHLATLNREHFAMVESASAKQNSIQSSGPSKPSSEALTHASVYSLLPKAQAVIHVHCPEIWRNTLALQLPHTGADIPYGTLEMAETVERLFHSGQLNKRPIFSMLGHEDGIVAFADSLATAAQIIFAQLAEALTIEQNMSAG